MSAKEISVVIRFRSNHRKEDELLREMKSLLCETRHQRGCLNFDLYRSVKGRDWFLLQTWEGEQSFLEYGNSVQAARLRAFLNEHTDWQRWQLEPVMD